MAEVKIRSRRQRVLRNGLLFLSVKNGKQVRFKRHPDDHLNLEENNFKPGQTPKILERSEAPIVINNTQEAIHERVDNNTQFNPIDFDEILARTLARPSTEDSEIINYAMLSPAHADVEMLDVSKLTPESPLHFAAQTQELFNITSFNMNDQINGLNEDDLNWLSIFE